MAEKKLLGLGERKLVGKPTKEKTRAGRTVYETDKGERVSEKSSTIPIGDKWYNVPSIYAGKKYTEDELKTAIENNRIIPTSEHNNKEDAIDAAKKRSNNLSKKAIPKKGLMRKTADFLKNLDYGELAEESLPIVGETAAIKRASTAFKEGDYLGTGIEAAAGLLGVVPFVGDIAGKALRTATKKYTKAEIKDAAPTWFKETPVSKDIKPEDAIQTQREITTATYVKAKDMLPEGKTLDFGAGKGIGAKKVKFDTYEPFPEKSFSPKYTDAKSIPSNSYDNVTSLNVLNVVKPETRSAIVQDIGRILKPGGTGIITTRGMSVFGDPQHIIKGVLADEPRAVITSIGTYQKGFRKKELLEYIQEELGNAFTVSGVKLGDAGVKIIKKSKDLNMAEGGAVTMNRQMDMFREGGLNQEGGMIDAESGNEVPVGSTREEVRDDIPAKLSEGEFVMPADVVRFHGLDKMMALRDEAKMGLHKMEAMGQMGNSEEATVSEEMPFGMADLIVVAEDGKEVEMAEGGYVTMAEGGLTPNNNPLENTRQLGATYRPPTSQPIDFTKVMGDGGISFKQYRNANGENLLVSFIGGVPITPIPEGYTEYTPGADEPVTPIQEVVQLSPPTPVANDEDRQRAGYEEGYSIGIENMTPDQLIEENRRRTSIFGKLAGALAFAINPAAGALYAFGVNRNKNKLLEAAKKNNMTDLASSIEKEKGIGGIVGGVLKILSNIVPESIKNSKLGQIANAAFNGEGSDPADIKTVTDNVKKETGMMYPRKRPKVSALPSERGPAIDFDKVSATFNPFAEDDGSIQVASADPYEAFKLFAEKQKQIGGGEFGGTPSNLSLASQMKNLGETQVSPNVGGTSGRLQDFRGGDPFKPLRGAGIGGSNMGRPDNVTDISTPASRQLTGPTTSNYGTQDFNAYGEGVTPGLRQGEIPPSPTGLQNFNTYSEGVTPGLRQGEIPPSPSGAPVLYDAFGNTTVFQGREGRRVDTGIPLTQDPTAGSLAYGARNVQDQLDAATSEYASNTPRPYNDPGAYTFAAPFGRQDAMGQFPSSPIPQASSSIPAPTGFNFVETERDRVRAGQPIFDQRDTITQESDRLRELGRQEEARRMQSDRGFIPTNIVGARPNDVFSTGSRGSSGLTSGPLSGDPFAPTRDAMGYIPPTPYNASFEREPAVSTNIQPTLADLAESGNVNAAGLNAGINLSSIQEAARAAELERIIAEAGAKPRPDESMYGAGTENQLEINRRRALEEYNNTQNQYLTEKANNENLLKQEGAYNRLVGGAEAGFRTAFPPRASEPTTQFPRSEIERQREFLANEARSIPRTKATVTDSELGSLSAPKGNPFAALDEVSKDLISGETDLTKTTLKDTKLKTVNMFGDTVTKGQKGSDEYLTDRTEVAAKEKVYKDKVNSKEFDTRGRDTLLRSGKVVGKNEPMAVYNREQEETGYIGTDAEGYGVGMIAGPGQAGVVVDENGKALRNGPGGVTGKTIYQDSTGVQYTKSTFGKKETLDGKKYTAAEGAKKGDGNDRDNDGEADSGKIICTAMNASYGFGSYRNAIWLNYSNKHLTKEHEVGYHTLFLPLVYLAYTKDIKFIRTLLEHGTRRRTADLRAELKGTKRNTLGRIYRSIFEPLCYTVGKIKIALGN